MEATRRPSLNIAAVSIFYFGLFLVSIWIDKAFHLFQFPSPVAPRAGRMAWDLVLGIACAFPVVLVTSILKQHMKAFGAVADEFRSMLKGLPWTQVFFLAGFSSLAEEFFFRGILQGSIGFVAATLIFGLLHIGPSRKFWPWTLFALIVGAWLGWIYEWRGNLLVPTTAHFTINLLNLWLLRLTK